MELSVQCSATKNIANSILNEYDDLKNNINQLIKLMNNVKLAWKGNDADKFVTSFQDSIINDLNSLSDLIKDYSNFLETAVSSYEALDNAFVSKEINV